MGRCVPCQRARSMTEQIPDHRKRHDQQHAHDDAAADAVH
jgi:hypothetical protein